MGSDNITAFRRLINQIFIILKKALVFYFVARMYVFSFSNSVVSYIWIRASVLKSNSILNVIVIDYFLESTLYIIKFIQIVLDDEWIINHKATSDEIKACVKDLQVLGKKDIRWFVYSILLLCGLLKIITCSLSEYF